MSVCHCRGSLKLVRQYKALMKQFLSCFLADHMTPCCTVAYALDQTFKQSLHHLVYLSHPQLHYCCFTHTSHCVRALKTKQMELVGNRRHANHGSFDWRSYLIIQPSGHLGEESIQAAYCTICVSNCYNIQLIMGYTKR